MKFKGNVQEIMIESKSNESLGSGRYSTRSFSARERYLSNHNLSTMFIDLELKKQQSINLSSETRKSLFALVESDKSKKVNHNNNENLIVATPVGLKTEVNE